MAVEPSLKFRLLDFGAAILEGEGIFVPFSGDATPPGLALGMAEAAETAELLSLDPLTSFAAKLLLDLDMALNLRSGVSLLSRLRQLSDSLLKSVLRSGSEGLRS